MAEPMEIGGGDGSITMHPSGLITQGDYEACLRVLAVAANHKDGAYKQPSFKGLRKAVVPFVQEMVSRFPTDPRRNRPERKEATKRAQRERRDADQAQDRKLLETTRLRSERNKKLKGLLHGVPDGVAEQNMLMGAIPTAQAALTDAATADGDSAGPVVAMGTALDGASGGGTLAANAPPQIVGELIKPRGCYICKCKFRDVHHFYDMLCPKCAELNYQKRTKIVDLSGYTIMVTGARIKIGYQAGLKLLRCGATVIVTTRFPADAERRYSAEGDHPNWSDRLHIYGLDMRNVVVVENFCQFIIGKYEYLDAIVNNACQTIRRPPKFYEHLMGPERDAMTQQITAAQTLGGNAVEWTGSHDPSMTQPSDSPGTVDAANKHTAAPLQAGHAGAVGAFELSQVAVLADDTEDAAAFPENAFDVNGQQIDMRSKTSWTLKLDEVQTPEMCEVLAVNSIAPFVLNSRLKGLLKKSPHPDRYVVNVSAMEGKFYRHKDVTHPHTNMAKAALNMMTRTSGADYRKDNIYMTSVDTGWINDENPLEKAQKIAETNKFQTPLDEIDAAARIVDPIISGVADGLQIFGEFLKDYVTTEW